MPNSDEVLKTAREASIQSRARGDSSSGLSLLMLLGPVAGGIVSPWWSRKRDSELRRFWRQIDHLSGAVYTMESRLKTIPFHIEPRDMNVRSHVKQAEQIAETLLEDSEFGEGWDSFYSKFTEDLTTQDNGAFAEVIGEGEPDGPILGRPFGVAQLDSAACWRTSDPEFPVVYHDPVGGVFKLHYTRVLYTSQMPSGSAQMHSIGFCAISRCINVAQNLLDMMVYKQEKAGSRPHRKMIITKGGLDPEDIRTAFLAADDTMNNQNLRRYSKTVAVGSANIPEAGIQEVDLSSMPEGFDEEESTTLGMAAIALAFGMDPRELWPAMTTGVTRAEALISHIKQRGKGPGEILQATERLFNSKYLPPHLKLVFDFQDDEQDRQVAEIRKTRSEYQVALSDAGLLDERTIREDMLQDGDITRVQFERMELGDGRLEDGSDALSLFGSEEFADLLDLGIENVLDFEANNAGEVLSAIRGRKLEIMGMVGSGEVSDTGDRALAALDRLEAIYGGTAAGFSKPKPPAPIPAQLQPPTQEQTGEPVMPSVEDLQIKTGVRGLINRAFRRDEDPLEGDVKHLEKLERSIADVRTELEDGIKQARERNDNQALLLLKEAVETMNKEGPPVVNITMPEQKAPIVNVTVPQVPAPEVRFDFPGLPQIAALIQGLIQAFVKMQAPIINVTPKAPDVQVNMPETPVTVQLTGDLVMPETVEETESVIRRRESDQKMIGLLTRTTKRAVKK